MENLCACFKSYSTTNTQTQQHSDNLSTHTSTQRDDQGISSLYWREPQVLWIQEEKSRDEKPGLQNNKKNITKQK